MRRLLATGTGATAALLLSTSVLAQQGGAGAGETIELAPLVVTGAPVPRSIAALPADVDVVEGAEKRRRQGGSLGDSIDHLSGVGTVDTGPNVGKPVLRGFTGDRVRVLSDGIALDHQQFGVRHTPNIDPFIAERIEVVRGAQSILYGSGALGGAVNLLPALPPTGPEGELTVSGETTLDYQTGFEQITGVQKLRAAYGRFGVAATFVGRHSDGFETPEAGEALDTGDPTDPLVTGEIPFTDFRQFNGDINLGYMTDIGQVRLRYEAYRSQQNFVVPDPPPPNGNPLQPGGIGQNLENDLVQLKAELALDDTWTIRPSFTFASNLRVANPGPPEPLPREFLPEAAVIDIRRNNFTGRIEAEHGPLFGLFEGRIGVEGLYVDQNSRGPTVLTPGGQIGNLAAFAFEELAFDRLTLNLGARVDYRTVELDRGQTAGQSDLLDTLAPGQDENTYLTATGSLGASYALTDNLFAVGNLGRGFRAPTLFELYADGVHGGVAAVQQGNPDLEPETSLSLDGGLRWQSERVSAKVTGYFNDISDFIFLAGTGTTNPASGLPVFQVSQQDARVWGADATLDVTPVDWLNLRGTIGFVDGELDDGTQVPLLPPLKLSGEVTLRQDRLSVFEDAYVTLGARYAASQDSAGLIEPFGQFDAPPPPFGTASTDSYVLLDVSVGATVAATGTEIAIAAENLLDAEYRDFLDTYKNITLGPGRNVMLRVTQPF